MNGKNIEFNDKKNLKSNFYNKSKKIFNIDDIEVNKILVPKKEQYGKYNSSKYFTGYNITVLLDHYNDLFHKQQAILINLIKIK